MSKKVQELIKLQAFIDLTTIESKLHQIEIQVDILKKARNKQKDIVFMHLAREMGKSVWIGQTFDLGTEFQYKVLSVGLGEFYVDNDTKYDPFVNAIRVKKGTKEVISSKIDSHAYSQRIYIRNIKNIILK